MGTPAARMPDPVDMKEKKQWFQELLRVQEQIAARRSAQLVGKTFRVLLEACGDGVLTGRTSGNLTIRIPGDAERVGEFAMARITDAGNWVLTGELVQLG